MSSNRLHRIGKSWPACRWLWLALSLLAMLLPLSGWQTPGQMQNFCAAGNSSDEGENEFPGEDEGGDAADSDLESHLLFRRSPRESLSDGVNGRTSALLPQDGGIGRLTRAIHRERDAAACSAARVPLRC